MLRQSAGTFRPGLSRADPLHQPSPVPGRAFLTARRTAESGLANFSSTSTSSQKSSPRGRRRQSSTSDSRKYFCRRFSRLRFKWWYVRSGFETRLQLLSDDGDCGDRETVVRGQTSDRHHLNFERLRSQAYLSGPRVFVFAQDQGTASRIAGKYQIGSDSVCR